MIWRKVLALGFACAVVGAVPGQANGEDSTAPAAVIMRRTAAGVTLLDEAGLSLYTFAGDSGGREATCVEACAKIWPPLRVKADLALSSPWSGVPRTDGEPQLAFQGQPLYRFKDDWGPGSRMGEAIPGGWKLAFVPTALPAGFSVQRALEGWVLATSAGRTLYTARTEGKPVAGAALFQAPALAHPQGAFTVARRKDGQLQWAYEGRPLYTAGADRKTGDLRGSGEGLVAVVLEKIPMLPPWVTVQISDTGEVLADAKGMTLYTVRDMKQVEKNQTCLADCMRANWRTVDASADAAPVGNWSIIEGEGGKKVWAYLGRQLFTHTRDHKPGDTMGYGFAVGHGIGGGWRPVMRSSLMPAT